MVCQRAHAKIPRFDRRGRAVDLKVKISITDEQTEAIVASTGMLDLASGEIGHIEYQGSGWPPQVFSFSSA